MPHLSTFLVVALLLVNLAGLSIAAYLLCRSFGCKSWVLARAASPLVVTIPFFIEHFWGFGSPNWIWVVTTAVSLGLIVWHWAVLQANWRTEAVFHGAFFYALAWCYAFPDLIAESEKICDLTFIANYFHGDRLPPVDRWLPPKPFEMYYAIEHYGAALMGRILAIPIGTAYHLAICVTAAAVVTAGAATAWLITRRRGTTMLLTAALMVGGTGAAPVIHLLTSAGTPYASVRFIGGGVMHSDSLRPVGRWVARTDRITSQSQDLPTELFSYLIVLGDYHPPLGGYLLLAVGLLSIALIEAGEAVGVAHAILAATVIFTIPTDSWNFPLQAFLAGAFLLYRLEARKPVSWSSFALGGIAAAALIAPFLVHFGPHALEMHNTWRLVPRDLHTPVIEGLIALWPVLTILGLNLIWGERSAESKAFASIWLAMLVISEFVYIDDGYGGKFARFNTALKWWAFIYSGTILIVGGLNLRSPSRIARWGTAAVLALISLYSVDLAVNYTFRPKPHWGELDGAAWLRDDPAQKAIMDYLASRPQAIVLQRVPDRAYVPAPALVIFSGQTALLGWANHEDLWRAHDPDVFRRFNQQTRFYGRAMPEALRWLEENRVDYVLWLDDENQLPAGTWEWIDEKLRGRYAWKDFSRRRGSPVGLWQRVTESPQ